MHVQMLICRITGVELRPISLFSDLQPLVLKKPFICGDSVCL